LFTLNTFNFLLRRSTRVQCRTFFSSNLGGKTAKQNGQEAREAHRTPGEEQELRRHPVLAGGDEGDEEDQREGELREFYAQEHGPPPAQRQQLGRGTVLLS